MSKEQNIEEEKSNTDEEAEQPEENDASVEDS